MDLWFAEDRAKNATCRHCGNPVEKCSDEEKLWFPQRTICYASMELASANNAYDALHKDLPWHDGTFSRWTKERTSETPYHYRDGVDLWVAETDINPDDQFLTREAVAGGDSS